MGRDIASIWHDLWGGGYLYARKKYAIGHDHYAVKSLVAISQAKQFPNGQAVMIGDSIAEMERVDSVCGKQVLNVSIGGTKIEDWDNLAPKILQITKPSIFIIALGTNNADKNDTSSLSFFEEKMNKLFSAAEGAKIIIVSPPTLDPTKRGASNFSALRLTGIQKYIASLRAKGLHVVEPTETNNATTDGVHLDTPAQKVWKDKLIASCPA